jgi:iron(III) transport system substrate-binding protein
MKKYFLTSGIAILLVSLFSLEFLSGVGRAGEAKPGWQLEWERVFQDANKEGQFIYYGTDTVETLFREFEKKYPIKAIAAAPAGGGRFATQRLPAERRANKYLADLYVYSSSAGYTLYQAKVFDPLKPALILPEVRDQSNWWQAKHHYADPESEYLLNFDGIFRTDVTFNTNLVSLGELKSYWDLLNPKWKGKIVVFDHNFSGFGHAPLKFLYYNPELGQEFLKKLYSDMDVTISSDPRQITDWLVKGRFVFALGAVPALLEAHVAKAQGLPVDWLHPKQLKEGTALSSGASATAFINRAPHPNAAKVAINWLLSREGQLAYQRILDPGHDSLRVDIPKDMVPPDLRRVEGVKYVNIDRPEWLDLKPIRDFINKVLAEGKK